MSTEQHVRLGNGERVHSALPWSLNDDFLVVPCMGSLNSRDYAHPTEDPVTCKRCIQRAARAK